MAGAGKAAATVMAGGGPEDPVGDVAAGAQVLGSKLKSKKPKEQDYSTAMGQPSAENKTLGSHTKVDSRRLLLTEFIVCVAVLSFGTLVPSPAGRKDEGMAHLLVKGTALSLLFFVLSLIGSSGRQAARAASGIGGLVTVAYLLTSEDGYNILTWISSFYGKPGSPGAGVATASYSGEYAGAIDINELLGPPRTAPGASETGQPTGTGGTLYA